MPDLSPEQEQYLLSQGYSPEQIKGAVFTPSQTQVPASNSSSSPTRAALAHVGGDVGGGLGSLGGMAAASWLGGPELGIPATIAAGLIGGGLGGCGGQKAQDDGSPAQETPTIMLEEAAQAHPYISGATDVALGALTGGGRLGLSPIRAALAGNPNAIRNLAQSSLLNAGIQSGTDVASQLYNTGTVNPGELGRSAISGLAGGALFSQPSRLGMHFMPSWRPTGNIQPPAEEPIEPEQRAEEQAQVEERSPIQQQALQSSKTVTDNYLQNLARVSQGNDPAIADAQRFALAKQDADKLLDPTMTSIKSVKKLLMKSVSPKMDETDKTAALVHNGQINSLNNAQLRQQAYQQSLENINPALADSHKQYQQDWTDLLKQRDTQWVANENARVKANEDAEQAKTTAEERIQQQKENDFTNAQNQHKLMQEQQKTEMFRERNLQLVQKGKDDAAIRQAKLNPASPERVAKTNLPENAAAGKLSNVARPSMLPEVKPTPETAPLAQESEEERKQQEADEIQKQLERRAPNSPDEGADLPQLLQDHIKSGRATTGSVLHSLANTPGHPYQELAGHLLRTADQDSLATPWRSGTSKDTSYYSPKKDSVTIHPEQLHSAPVYIEEAAHSMMEKKLPTELSGLRGRSIEERTRPVSQIRP